MVLVICGQKVKCVNVAGLAKLCNRQAATIRKLEQQGIMPPANFRTPETEGQGVLKGTMRPGNRVYTYEFALKIAEVFAEHIFQGKEIPQVAKVKLREIFIEEKTKFIPNA